MKNMTAAEITARLCAMNDEMQELAKQIKPYVDDLLSHYDDFAEEGPYVDVQRNCDALIEAYEYFLKNETFEEMATTIELAAACKLYG